MAKTKYVSETTILTADVANSWYGGLAGTPEGAALPSNDPRVIGHQHDGQNRDGSASKINLVSHVTGQLGTANIANLAVTNDKIANATITESKLAFSLPSGGTTLVAPETFVFRPGGTADGNVYTDFATLYTDYSAAEGRKIVVFDDSLATVTIPAGTYDFDGGSWTAGGIRSTDTTLGLTQVGIANGVTINNLLHIDGLYIRNNGATTPLVYDTGGDDYLIVKDSVLSNIVATTALLRVSTGTTLTLIMRNSSVLSFVGIPVLNIGVGSSLTPQLYSSSIDNDMLAGSGTVTGVLSDANSYFSIDPADQPTFTGVLPSSFSRVATAEYITFVPTGTLTGTNVQTGMEQIYGLEDSYQQEMSIYPNNTVTSFFFAPYPMTLTGVKVYAHVAPVTAGTYTLQVFDLDNSNNLLSTATFDMTSLVAETVTDLTLTATTADLSFTTDTRVRVQLVSDNGDLVSDGIYFKLFYRRQ